MELVDTSDLKSDSLLVKICIAEEKLEKFFNFENFFIFNSFVIGLNARVATGLFCLLNKITEFSFLS